MTPGATESGNCREMHPKKTSEDRSSAYKHAYTMCNIILMNKCESLSKNKIIFNVFVH